jgi:predicted nuclease with TOPRIM domain
VESRRRDPLPGLTADLLRGDAAYRRDESDELKEAGRALRAKAERLRRHFHELQENSAALKAESAQLRRQFRRRRASGR